MNLENLFVYSAQVCVVVAVSAGVAKLARLKSPDVRLVWWQLVLLSCLALPGVRPWNVPQVYVQTSTGQDIPITPIAHAVPAVHIDWSQLVLFVVAAGIAWRLLLLSLGLVRLSRYRRNSIPLEPQSQWCVEAQVLVSPDVSGPVTFGVRHPVILLPSRCRTFNSSTMDAILCHEILHVRRKDWLFTVAEELVRAALWFHPAVWWVLAEIQLAREETVDQAVIDMTQARDCYVDALLTIAGGGRESELAPAPLFLRKRHLKQRVVTIFKEVGMSRRMKIVAFTVSTVALAAACWVATSTLPLQAAPQEVVDAQGISVDVGDTAILHRRSVGYPQEAIVKGVQGEVAILVKIGGDGDVSDATIVSGPEELRKPVLRSVLDWHFDRSEANSTRQIVVRFRLPTGQPATRERLLEDPKNLDALARKQMLPGINMDKLAGLTGPQPANPQTIDKISVTGVSQETRWALVDKLQVLVGRTASQETMELAREAVHSLDSHLVVRTIASSQTASTLVVSAPAEVTAMADGSAAAHVPVRQMTAEVAADPPTQLRVGGDAAQNNLSIKVNPVYPPMAKQARVQGTIRFEVVIARDGSIRNLHLVSGPPLLVQSAIEAVRQWVYKPTLLNGNPVEVITTIDVNYTLSE